MRLFQIMIGVIVLITSGASAVYGQSSYGRSTRAGLWRLYDPSTVETIQGIIVAVNSMASRKGQLAGQRGVHCEVKTSSGIVVVHLGPEWYIAPKTKLAVNDRIEVTGSRISYRGSPVIIARTIKTGTIEIILRDETGRPLWMKQRGRGGWKNK